MSNDTDVMAGIRFGFTVHSSEDTALFAERLAP